MIEVFELKITALILLAGLGDSSAKVSLRLNLPQPFAEKTLCEKEVERFKERVQANAQALLFFGKFKTMRVVFTGGCALSKDRLL